MTAHSQLDGLPLFTPKRNPRVRKSDPETSRAAAARVEGRLSELQAKVLTAFLAHGPMTAEECENLDYFGNLAPSTVRKRISEMAKMDPPELLVHGVAHNDRGSRLTRYRHWRTQVDGGNPREELP